MPPSSPRQPDPRLRSAGLAIMLVVTGSRSWSLPVSDPRPPGEGEPPRAPRSASCDQREGGAGLSQVLPRSQAPAESRPVSRAILLVATFAVGMLYWVLWVFWTLRAVVRASMAKVYIRPETNRPSVGAATDAGAPDGPAPTALDDRQLTRLPIRSAPRRTSEQKHLMMSRPPIGAELDLSCPVPPGVRTQCLFRTRPHHSQETMSMTKPDTGTLYALSDRGQTVDGSANDVRGRHVQDQDGNKIGRVVDLIVDDQDKKVRFLLVDHGGFLGFGGTHTMIPVDVVSKVTETEVCIDQSRDRIASAPGYAPDLIADRSYLRQLYEHYGHLPYWGMGYSDPYSMPESLPWGRF